MAADLAAARARVHPRLPADGRAQDVQVAGQRARPVRGDGPLRHRRAALLPAARGGVRQDGSISPEGFETRYNTELANEYGNLASRSLAMIAQATATAWCPRPQAPAELAAEFDGLADAVRECLDRVEVSARARGHLAARARAQPLRDQDDGAVEAVQGRAKAARARLGALRAGRGAARGLGAAAPVDARVGRAAARGARAARTARWTRAGFGDVGGGAHDRRARPALPEGRAARGRRRA